MRAHGRPWVLLSPPPADPHVTTVASPPDAARRGASPDPPPRRPRSAAGRRHAQPTDDRSPLTAAITAAAAAAAAAGGAEVLVGVAAAVSAARAYARWRAGAARKASLASVTTPSSPTPTPRTASTGPPDPPWRDDAGAAARAPPRDLPPLPDGAVVLLDETLPLSVRAAWRETVCGQGLETAFHAARGDVGVSTSGWHVDGPPAATTARRSRVVTYTTPLKANLLGPRASACVETWTCDDRGDSGWTAAAAVATPGVPFGDSFRVRLQWACVKVDRDGKHHPACRLRVAGRVTFSSPPSLPGVRSMITVAAVDGLRSSYGGYRAHLASQFGGTAVDALPTDTPPGDRVTDRLAALPPATVAGIALAIAAVAVLALIVLVGVGLAREAALLRELVALREAVAGRRAWEL